MNTFFSNIGESVLNKTEFTDSASCGNAGDVLALIGDAALDLAVVEALWDSSLSQTGLLTVKREKIVKNENLAKICDRLDLFKYRLKRFIETDSITIKEKKVIHEKGTLIEAIFGVIYLEFGFEAILRTVPLLQ